MQIRIVLVANKGLSKFAKNLAKRYSKLSASYFWVDGKKFTHHITLCDIFPDKGRLNQASKTVLDIAEKRTSLDLSSGSLWKGPSKVGYIGLKFGHTKKLIDLRKKIIENLKDYNPKTVGKFFNAHMTLTRFKDFNFSDKMGVGKLKRKSFNFGLIAFAKVNKHGQVIKILKTFRLKS